MESEILFWKIIRNKYLFKRILKEIQNGLIKFTSLEKIYCGNRVPFKAIKSLSWLLEKKQLSILRDKLINNKYLHIYKGSIEQFLKTVHQKELITLLYEKKFKQLLIVDLIKASIEFRNETALKIFLNKRKEQQLLEITYFPIYPSTILYAIQNSAISMVQLLLEHFNSNEKATLITPILDQVLKVALSNFYYKDDMISYIVNNSSGDFPICSNSTTTATLSYFEFSTLKSVDTKMKLLEMNQVIQPPKYNIKFNNIDNSNEKELLLIITIIKKLYYYNEEDEEIKITNLEKQLSEISILPLLEERKKKLKLIIIKELYSDQLYLNYLVQYGGNEIIPNFKERVVTTYAFSTFNTVALNYLLRENIEEVVLFSIDHFKEALLESISSNQKEIKEFISLLYSNGNDTTVVTKFRNQFKRELKHVIKLLLLNSKVSIETLDFIINIQGFPIIDSFLMCVTSPLDIIPFSKYKWYIDECLLKKVKIDSDNYKFYNQIPPLNQTEIIDFIIENKQFYQISNNNLKLLNFKSIDKLNYFKSKWGNNVNLPIAVYNKSFFKALSNCDVDSLKSMESTFKEEETSEEYDEISNLNYYYQYGCFSNFEEIKEYSNLFNYLNSGGFKIFFYKSPDIFIEYINELFDTFGNSGNLEEIKIDFNQFPKQTYQILLNQILVKQNLQIIKFICNQFNFKFIDNYFQLYSSKVSIPIQVQINKNTFKSSNSNNNWLKIKSIINYLITICKNGEDGCSTLFQTIFNLLYKLSLSSIDFQFSQIIQLNQLYSINGISIDSNNDLYKTFYYLVLKDIRFGKYLFIKRLIHFERLIMDLNSNTNNEMLSFSFEEIKNNTFGETFFKLRNIFSISNNNCGVKNFMSHVNLYRNSIEDYIFLLECNEIQLYLKILEQDSKRVGEESFIQEFFDVKNNLIKIFDKESIVKLLNLSIENYDLTNYLEQAFNESRLDIIKFLFKKFKDQINQISDYYYQSLFKSNQIDIIKYLFSNTTTIGNHYYNNLTSKKQPIFDIVFYNGYIECCDLLLSIDSNNSIKPSNIIDSIKNNQISIIIYYLNNGILNLEKDIFSNNEIVDLLNSHKDYFYLKLK